MLSEKRRCTSINCEDQCAGDGYLYLESECYIRKVQTFSFSKIVYEKFGWKFKDIHVEIGKYYAMPLLVVTLGQGCTTFCYCRQHYFYLYEVRPPMSSSYIYEIRLINEYVFSGICHLLVPNSIIKCQLQYTPARPPNLIF